MVYVHDADLIRYIHEDGHASKCSIIILVYQLQVYHCACLMYISCSPSYYYVSIITTRNISKFYKEKCKIMCASSSGDCGAGF